MSIVIAPYFTVPDIELTERFTASGGPGGQHANKAATRVELIWNIEGSVVVSEHQRKVCLLYKSPSARVLSTSRMPSSA